MTRRRLGIAGVLFAVVAIGLFVTNALTKGLVWGLLTQRTDLLLTGAVAAACGYVVVRALVDLAIRVRAKQAVETAKTAFAASSASCATA